MVFKIIQINMYIPTNQYTICSNWPEQKLSSVTLDVMNATKYGMVYWALIKAKSPGKLCAR